MVKEHEDKFYSHTKRIRGCQDKLENHAVMHTDIAQFRE